MVLKQCGHWVTILRTPRPLSVSMFCMASIWKMYSLPERRARAPGHLPARAAGRVAGTQLRRTQDGEVDAGPVHELGHGLGDLLVLVVEGPGAAHPVEELVLEGLAAVDDRHLDGNAVGPVGPLALAEAPRVRLVLHRAVGVAELGGE